MRNATLPLLLVASWANAQNYTITTVAGGAPTITTGQSATSYAASFVTSVAEDSMGNTYLVLSSLCQIWEVNSSGTLTQVIGTGNCGYSGDGGSAASAQLNAPAGAAVDSSGNLYIADSGNNRIREVSGGNISTVAGNGNTFYNGDGMDATSAALYSPAGVAVDSSGNFYIADTGNCRIRKVSGGIINTVAGSGSYGFGGDGSNAVLAQLAYPKGIAVDGSGGIYIADTNNQRVRKVAGGIINTLAGNGSPGYSGDGGGGASAQLNNPTGVAVDSTLNVYIADTNNNRIRKVSGGNISTIAGNGSPGYFGDGGGAVYAEVSGPLGVAVDSFGLIYIADTGNNVVRKVTGGVIATLAGDGSSDGGIGGVATSAQLVGTQFSAVDSSGNLYISDLTCNVYKVASGTKIVSLFAGNGTCGYGGDTLSATSQYTQLNNPHGIAVDSSGNVYIADSSNNRIREVSGGIINTVAGNGSFGYSGDGGLATSAQLEYPQAVAVDSLGALYIADRDNNRIRKVSGGAISTVAGSGAYGYSGDGASATAAAMKNPQGVAVDNSGFIYIADTGNNVVRKVSGGNITTVAGSTQGFSGDGASATSAQLNTPNSVGVDSSGNLYIADTNNQRIRKVAGGNITTIAGTGAIGYNGDNINGISASLSSPIGVAIDGSGDVFVADSNNNRIRELIGTAQLSQTITFGALSNQLLGSAPFTVSATASSGLTVSFASTTSPVCTVSSATVTLVSTGTCSITASQAGNTAYAAAPSVTQSFTVSQASPPSAVSVSPSSGSGLSQTFNFTFADPLGYHDMVWQQVIINSGLTAAGGCYMYYIPSSNQIYLGNNSGSGTVGPQTLGTSGTLQNSQCVLNVGSSTATGSGNNLTLNLALTFESGFMGAKTIWADTASNAGLSMGWQSLGTWTPGTAAPPSATSVSPSSGSGLSQTFSFVFADSLGYQDMVWQQIIINSGLTAAGGCYVYYSPSTNQIYLGNNSGSGTLGPQTLGTSGTLQNSQCLLNVGSSTATGSGNNLTLNLALTFESGFTGAKTIWADTASSGGLSMGWQSLGTWTPGTAGPPSATSVSPSSGTGLSQTFSFVFADPLGYQDMVWQQIIINSGLTATGGCYIYYSPSSKQIYVGNNSGSGTLGPLTVGTSGTLQNSQCVLNVGSSTATGSGNNLTLNLALTFESGFTGAKTIWADTASNAGLSMGWQTLGTWTPASATPPSATSVSPSSGSGVSQTFSFVFADPLGYQDMAWQQIIINSGLTAAGGCYIYYSPSSNQLYLGNNAGSGTLGPVTVGTSGTLQNSQCSLNVGSSTATGSGNNLTLNLALTFESGFTGAKTIWADTASNAGLSMGWQTLGTWTPGAAGPAATSVSPSSGSGISQTFSFVFTDASGYQDMAWQQIIINSGLTAAGGCYIYYSPSSKQIYLGNNAGSGTLGPQTLGTSGTLQNSQCSLNVGSSSVVDSGNTLTLNLALTFESGFTGAQNIWADTASNAGLSMGWQSLGSWTP